MADLIAAAGSGVHAGQTALNLRHLRYYLTLAEEMNFTRAAERLHVAQPPLSVQIKDLEEMVGVPLLDRSSRPFRLTEAGLFFKGECRRILADISHTVEQTRRVDRKCQEWIGIGFGPSILHSFLPAVLKQFRDKHPHIELVLQTMTREQQAEALRNRRIHVGITRPRFETDEFVQSLVFREQLGFVCLRNHRFANSKSITLSQLKDERFIAYDSGVDPEFIREAVSRASRDPAFEPNIAMKVDQPITALSAVSAGFGVSFVANSLADALSKECCIIPIAGSVPQNPIYVVHRHGESSDAAVAFLKAIKEFETPMRRLGDRIIPDSLAKVSLMT